MYKIYYLHSKKGDSEAICICDDEDMAIDIENPILISNEYPLGIIFSKMLRTISAWIDNPYKVSLNEMLEAFSTKDSSFSSISCDDSALKSIFFILMNDDKGVNTHLIIKKYIAYIDKCCDDKEYESAKMLDMFVFSSECSYPKRTIYSTGDEKDVNTVATDFLALDKNISHRSKKLFNITKKNHIEFIRLIKPLTIYEINDVSDLILASISAVISQGYSIGKCRECKNYFVSPDRKRKYCKDYREDKDKNKDKEDGSCYEKANRKRISDKNASQSRKMYNSIREMYSRKIGNDYEIFRKESKEWNRKIRQGKETEENYVAWLKSKYARKYKK